MSSKDCFVAFAANAASVSVLDHVNGITKALEQGKSRVSCLSALLISDRRLLGFDRDGTAVG